VPVGQRHLFPTDACWPKVPVSYSCLLPTDTYYLQVPVGNGSLWLEAFIGWRGQLAPGACRSEILVG